MFESSRVWDFMFPERRPESEKYTNGCKDIYSSSPIIDAAIILSDLMTSFAAGPKIHGLLISLKTSSLRAQQAGMVVCLQGGETWKKNQDLALQPIKRHAL